MEGSGGPLCDGCGYSLFFRAHTSHTSITTLFFRAHTSYTKITTLFLWANTSYTSITTLFLQAYTNDTSITTLFLRAYTSYTSITTRLLWAYTSYRTIYQERVVYYQQRCSRRQGCIWLVAEHQYQKPFVRWSRTLPLTCDLVFLSCCTQL